jgi:hypothetical protein
VRTDLIDQYVDAIERSQFDRVLDAMGSDAVFQSPFHAWPARQLPAVYAARATALSRVAVDAVVRDRDRAAILWRAQVADTAAETAPVQSCEVVSITGSTIDRVDVFLRPADVLPLVHAAMVRAWPVS